jgi:hypothetical protein
VTQLKAIAKMMQSNLSKVGAALLLASLAACGSSDTAISTEGGPSTERESTADAGKATESGGAADDASAGEGESPADGGPTTDGGRTTNGGTTTSAPAVNLGTAGDYVILAKTGISTVPTSAITGNLGVSPAAATYITGFTLIADSTNVFATASQVTGRVYAADYAVPTPSNLTTAVGDMQQAYTDAAGRTASVTELGAGNIGGMTLRAGVYRWGTSLLIPTSVTLAGSGTDVWILQIAKNLTVNSATSIALTGGAVAKNVFWQVAGSTGIGTTAHFEGVILDQTAITLGTGASINGRLLAQTAVNIESSVVVEPAP